MTNDVIITSLFVFALAAFLGFELIRRPSCARPGWP